MGFKWGTTCCKCRMAINIVPFWSSPESELPLLKVRLGGFGTGNSSLCGTDLIADRKCGYCTVFGFGCDSCYVCWTKVTFGWAFFWFPPNYGNGERHLARTIYPSCDQPHTRYTTKTRGLTFILFTHFTSKIKFVTFLNERGKLSPLRFEGNFTTNVTEGVRMILNISLPWWKYNKQHNSFTQNTSLKRTHNTCNLSQRSPAIQ
jgi:hypothetical protein